MEHVYMGIDVGKKFCSVCVLNEEGERPGARNWLKEIALPALSHTDRLILKHAAGATRTGCRAAAAAAARADGAGAFEGLR